MNIQDFKTVNELIEKQRVEIAKLKAELVAVKSELWQPNEIIRRAKSFLGRCEAIE